MSEKLNLILFFGTLIALNYVGYRYNLLLATIILSVSCIIVLVLLLIVVCKIPLGYNYK